MTSGPLLHVAMIPFLNLPFRSLLLSTLVCHLPHCITDVSVSCGLRAIRCLQPIVPPLISSANNALDCRCPQHDGVPFLPCASAAPVHVRCTRRLPLPSPVGLVVSRRRPLPATASLPRCFAPRASPFPLCVLRAAWSRGSHPRPGGSFYPAHSIQVRALNVFLCDRNHPGQVCFLPVTEICDPGQVCFSASARHWSPHRAPTSLPSKCSELVVCKGKVTKWVVFKNTGG